MARAQGPRPGCYQAPSRAIARDLAAGVVADYGRELPSAVACFEDDFEACIAHLRMPVTHRRAIRTTNLLERLFLEERRRLKIIPNAFGERPVLKLMFGAMTRAADRWRAIKFTDFERRQIAAVRRTSTASLGPDQCPDTRVRNAEPVPFIQQPSDLTSRGGNPASPTPTETHPADRPAAAPPAVDRPGSPPKSPPRSPARAASAAAPGSRMTARRPSRGPGPQAWGARRAK